MPAKEIAAYEAEKKGERINMRVPRPLLAALKARSKREAFPKRVSGRPEPICYDNNVPELSITS